MKETERRGLIYETALLQLALADVDDRADRAEASREAVRALERLGVRTAPGIHLVQLARGQKRRKEGSSKT